MFIFSVFSCLYLGIFFPNEIYMNLGSFVFLNGLPWLLNYLVVSALTPSGNVAIRNDLPLPLFTRKEVSPLRGKAPSPSPPDFLDRCGSRSEQSHGAELHL